MGKAAISVRTDRRLNVPTISGESFDETLVGEGKSLFEIFEERETGKRLKGYVILPTQICRPADQNCVRKGCPSRAISMK